MSSDDFDERGAPERAGSLPSDVTANVWADAPSQNASSGGVDAVTGQFDDFDPFKPASAASATSSHLDAPPTPLKVGSPLPAKEVDQEEKRDDPPASATGDLEKAEKDNSSINASAKDAGKGPETPVKAKPAAPAAAAGGTGPTSQSMTPTGSGSSLSRGLDTIASAFRRRSISTNPTPSAGPSSPRPATPLSTTTKPSMLVLDKDEMDEMDESEREAPPAMPTLTMSYSQSGSGNEAPQTDDTQQQEQEDETPQFDFNLFLEQMRSRPADPIAKYLRSFLKEFAKRTWGVNDQIRVINDFLDVR